MFYKKKIFNQKSHIKWLNCFKMIIVEMTTLQDSLCLSIQISIVVARHQCVKFELPNRAPHVALSYEKDGLWHYVKEQSPNNFVWTARNDQMSECIVELAELL